MAAAMVASRTPSCALVSAAAALIDGQRVDDLGGDRRAADLEVLDGSLGARAPESVGGDVQLAHAVALDARPVSAHPTTVRRAEPWTSDGAQESR